MGIRPADPKHTSLAIALRQAQLVEEDQQARSASWSNLSEADLKAIGEADRKRFRRIVEIVSAGSLSTAKDFANAALICQHRHRFDSVVAILFNLAGLDWPNVFDFRLVRDPWPSQSSCRPSAVTVRDLFRSLY